MITVEAKTTSVEVDAVAMVAAVTIDVKIGRGGGDENVIETISVNGTNVAPTNKNVDIKLKTINGEAISGTGNIEIEGGEVSPPEFNLTIEKGDVVWDGTYIQIAHTEAVNALKMTDILFTVDTVGGLRELEAVVIYPAPETNVTTGVAYFLVRDASGFLKPETNFDRIHLSYNVVADTVSKYDIKYKLTGENIVNNHEIGYDEHSRFTTECCRVALKDDATGIDLIRTDIDLGTMVTNEHQPRYFEKKDANISFSPIVFWYQNQDLKSNADIMEVFSHYDNNFTRHDTTAAEDIFFENSVAVSARSEDITDHTGATSYGFGLEFMEDLSVEKVDAEYGTEKVFEKWICGVTTDAAGEVLTSAMHPTWVTGAEREVGDVIWRWDAEYNKYDITYITEILAENSVRVSPAITPSESVVIYFAGLVKFSNAIKYSGGAHGTQSVACPIVAAKLKRIRLATNASWNQVRMAARATASNNGIWDMYRGFGIINVEAAIAYIQDNYHTDDYVEELAKQLENDREISPLLDFEDILNNSPVPKRHIVELLAGKQTKSLLFTNVSVLTTDFVADTTYTDYGFKAEITAAGATSADVAEVIFAPTESDSGNFASVAATGTDTVTIYAKAVPSATITIPTILITKL